MTPSEIINRFSGWENDEGAQGIIADALEEIGFDLEANAMRRGVWEWCTSNGVGWGVGADLGSGTGDGFGEGSGYGYGFGFGDGDGSGDGE